MFSGTYFPGTYFPSTYFGRSGIAPEEPVEEPVVDDERRGGVGVRTPSLPLDQHRTWRARGALEVRVQLQAVVTFHRTFAYAGAIRARATISANVAFSGDPLLGIVDAPTESAVLLGF